MIKNIIDENEKVDVVKSKLEKLKELFPNCFNKDGNFDIEILKEEISKDTNIVKEG